MRVNGIKAITRSERGGRRDFILLDLERSDGTMTEKEVGVLQALGKHCLCQRGVVGGIVTTIVTDFAFERDLVEHLSSAGQVVQMS